MRIFLFLLDTLFFLLVGAALLRGWMNTRRLRMTQQPGLFVMAISDWIVKPLRKVLPRAWAQANTDWGSFSAAVLLCLLYSLVWNLLVGGMELGPMDLSAWFWLVVALVFLVRTVLQGLMVLVLAHAVISWVQPMSPMYGMLSRLVAPLLRPFQRVVPVVGGVDLSSLLLLVLLQIGLMLLG